MNYSYVADFKRKGYGLFNHFGLYSVLGKGEWYKFAYKVSNKDYEKLFNQFRVAPNWAMELAKTAKEAGFRYITLTTRHHEGFSLYDTRGLNAFDAPHSPTGRDLVEEFVEACRHYGLTPVFYHTVIDWRDENFQKGNFAAYFTYLKRSIEILCTQYGKIGGIWFDGTWGLPKGVSFPEDIYRMIHHYQPNAIITNNTGLSCLGQQGTSEIDCVTFERGKPFKVEGKMRPIAGEVCESVDDHWGYTENDINAKSPKTLIETLIDCRSNDCNLLLNTGLKGNGSMKEIDKQILLSVGRWLSQTKNVVLEAKPSSLKAKNASVFEKGGHYFAVIKDVPMSSNANVAKMKETCLVRFETTKKICNALWIDDGTPLQFDKEESFLAKPFDYGNSLTARILQFDLE